MTKIGNQGWADKDATAPDIRNETDMIMAEDGECGNAYGTVTDGKH